MTAVLPTHEKVVVQTTLPKTPLPSNSERAPITTERLILRPLQQDDFEAFRALRLQPEAMTGTRQGRPDRSDEETQRALDDFLSPHDGTSFLFGVFLAATGQLIGEGGVHTLRSADAGWPEIGYKFRREVWGRGYATEFLRALLAAWWALPRTAAEVAVAGATVSGAGADDDDDDNDEGIAVREERLYANAEVANVGSARVLEKAGFARFAEWTEPDTQEHRVGQPVDLVGYVRARELPLPGRQA